jgi:hypothetical protein
LERPEYVATGGALRRHCTVREKIWFDETELRGADAWDVKIRRQIGAARQSSKIA